MTIAGGKNLIQDCMNRCECTEAFDNIIIYKYGNRINASAYHQDIISTSLSRKEYIKSARYVVKCFIRTEIYVAWDAKAINFKDTYTCDKRNVEEMESGILGNWYESPQKDDKKFYLFKGRTGVMEFVKRKLM